MNGGEFPISSGHIAGCFAGRDSEHEPARVYGDDVEDEMQGVCAKAARLGEYALHARRRIHIQIRIRTRGQERSMVIMMLAAAEVTIFRRRRQPRVYAPEEFAGAKLVRRGARATGLRTHPVPNTSPNTDVRACSFFGARPSVTSACVCVSVQARAYSGMIRVLSVG